MVFVFVFSMHLVLEIFWNYFKFYKCLSLLNYFIKLPFFISQYELVLFWLQIIWFLVYPCFFFFFLWCLLSRLQIIWFYFILCCFFFFFCGVCRPARQVCHLVARTFFEFYKTAILYCAIKLDFCSWFFSHAPHAWKALKAFPILQMPFFIVHFFIHFFT